MIRKIRQWLFKEKHNGRFYTVGLIRDKEDERDLKLGFSFFGYTPLHKVKVLKTYSIKNQAYNTCGQESYTVQAEVDEKCELSERSQTCFMRKSGLISGDGFSSLKGNQQSGINNGIAEKEWLTGDDFKMGWEQYSNPSALSQRVIDNATLHKAKNYASIMGRNARLKTLDEGSALHTGMDWYSGFNISGGFGSPWIITKNSGWLVGGHAVAMIGYDLPRNVYIIQNSYGETWGGYVDSEGNKHAGCFAVDMDFFDKYGHATYKRIDLDENLDELIAQYEGKQVKVKGNPAIYKIVNGTKKSYPDAMTFYADGGFYGKWGTSYVSISGALLDKIQDGGQILMEETLNYPYIKNNLPMLSTLSEPQNLEKLKEIIKNENPYSSNLKFMKGKYGVLTSSVDPNSISLTLKAFIPMIMLLVVAFKLDIVESDVDTIISAIGAIISAGFTIWGIIRKFIKK